MAAITGFDFSISGGDVVIEDGLINGVAVEGSTLDLAPLSLADGVADIVYDGSAVTAEAAVSGTNIKLGEVTVASDAATATSLNGRGDTVAVSADV